MSPLATINILIARNTDELSINYLMVNVGKPPTVTCVVME